MKKESVELSDITFYYEPRGDMLPPALKTERLCFEQGKCYIITGACGSGKTTLALLLKGLVNPTSGSIVIQGNQRELGAFQRDIGFLFQYPEEQFFQETVAEEIAFGPRLLGLGDIGQRVEKSLRAVGLSGGDFNHLSPFELSSGEQRRVAIASVIACRPSWYIFDEPTAGLDPEGKQLLLGLMEQLVEDGNTVLIITQELGVFSRLCDEVLFMERGRVRIKTGIAEFLSCEGERFIADVFPYHIQVLRQLRKNGWDLSIAILDEVTAAAAIADKIR